MLGKLALLWVGSSDCRSNNKETQKRYISMKEGEEEAVEEEGEKEDGEKVN